MMKGGIGLGGGGRGGERKRGRGECLSYLPLKACLHTASYQKETVWFNEKISDSHHQKVKKEKDIFTKGLEPAGRLYSVL